MYTAQLPAILAALGLDPAAGLSIVGAEKLPEMALGSNQGLLVLGQGPAHLPAVLAVIRGNYPADHLLSVMTNPGTPTPRVEQRRAQELGPEACGEDPWAIYVPPGAHPARGQNFGQLVQVMATLRGPDGCPWDREQNHTTLRPYMLEEAYEAVSAINAGDLAGLQEELGDVLLQVVFHAQMAREAGTFDIDDVIRSITEKLIRRHPHVFGATEVSGAAEVVQNWEAIKAAERAGKAGETPAEESAATPAPDPALLDGVGQGMPALLRAYKVQRKAAKVGFDWPDIEGPLAKVHEELAELQAAYQSGDRARYEEEFGDLLFAAVNVARFLQVDPEVALTATVDKFVRRFAYIEAQARRNRKKLSEMGLAEMDRLWDEAKRAEK